MATLPPIHFGRQLHPVSSRPQSAKSGAAAPMEPHFGLELKTRKRIARGVTIASLLGGLASTLVGLPYALTGAISPTKVTEVSLAARQLDQMSAREGFDQSQVPDLPNKQAIARDIHEGYQLKLDAKARAQAQKLTAAITAGDWHNVEAEVTGILGPNAPASFRQDTLKLLQNLNRIPSYGDTFGTLNPHASERMQAEVTDWLKKAPLSPQTKDQLLKTTVTYFQQAAAEVDDANHWDGPTDRSYPLLSPTMLAAILLPSLLLVIGLNANDRARRYQQQLNGVSFEPTREPEKPDSPDKPGAA